MLFIIGGYGDYSCILEARLIFMLFIIGGYDSDVERERTIDYVSKTYVNPIREATLGPKPTPDKPLPDTKRNVVSRNVTTVPKVAVREEEDQVEVKVSDYNFSFFTTQQESMKKFLFYL